MDERFVEHLRAELAAVREAGLEKRERTITSRQGALIRVAGPRGEREVLNFCANNYLGLSGDPRLVAVAKDALDRYGFGLSSVRFICGTQDIHRELETRLSRFLGTEDTILYSSCFDANGGLFEALLGEPDAIISDALNHASIIDGIRLSKAARHRYANGDLGELAQKLELAAAARFKLIATDGVFSMDGTYADLRGICELAERHGAITMVDDSHAVGFVGERGRGSHERAGVMGRVDVLTGTLGKALGGASGGYVSGRAEIVEWLRQKSRPYLFSNSVAPTIVKTTLAVLDMIEGGSAPLEQLRRNTRRFRDGLTTLGYRITGDDHPIVPVMLGDAKLASTMADALLDEDIYVIGFSFPVVPKGEARIRTQMSAAHRDEHVDRALEAFARVGKKLGVIK